LTGFAIYVTKGVVIVGLFAIGNMVQQAKTAHLIGTFWLIKPVIGMPSQWAGSTIDRAPISLDSARRESWKPPQTPGERNVGGNRAIQACD
jgi:hypothetical protein